MNISLPCRGVNKVSGVQMAQIVTVILLGRNYE